MNKSERCLIAVDLDNTILSGLYSLCCESVYALIEAQSAGHVVMIATARPRAMAMPWHRAMGLRGPISTLNGAYLYHPDDPAFPPHQDLICAESTAAISAAAARAGLRRIWFEVDDGVRAVQPPREDFYYFREVFRQSGAACFPVLPAEPAARIYACADAAAQADALLDAAGACADVAARRTVSASGEHRVNFNSVRADKWFAVRRAAEFYGIPRENIIAFGDEINDRQMILSAGHGFALCNGSRALQEEALRAGASVTEYPCAEGGVARALRGLIL